MKLGNAPGAQSTEWRLPSTDPRDEGKYLFRLHTLDIYFWTKEDAALFVKHCQHTLHQEQLDIDFPIPTPHAEVMSPVVQQLENVAITDPAYANGKTPGSAGASSKTALAKTQSKERQDSPQYTPLAYNPAAPPAPEKRAHREKTPPPPDPGTGLHAAAYDDHTGPILPGPVASATQAFAGPPTSHPYNPSPTSASHGYSSPSSHPSSTAPFSQGFQPPPTTQNAHLYGDDKPSMESPTAQILGQSYLTSPTQPLQHLQPQYPDYLGSHTPVQQTAQRPPPGGYSDYSYQQQQAAYNPGYYPSNTGDYNIHSQVYRPTEDEAGGKPPKHGVAGPGAATPGKWEQKAEKAEKGINRLLRKAEKKFG